MNRRRSKSAHWRTAGTLLEVLVSLLVLAMILQLVVEVSGRMRASRMLVRNRRDGADAALRWRAAAQARDRWASGEQGEFPDHKLGWRLVALEIGKVPTGADDNWRRLQLWRSDESGPFYEIALRLEEQTRQAPTASASIQASD